MIKLKEHGVYPEIQVDEEFNWSALLIDLHGKTVESFVGKSDSRENAIKEAVVELNKVEKFMNGETV